MLEERAKRSLELDRRGKGVPSVRLCLSGFLLCACKANQRLCHRGSKRRVCFRLGPEAPTNMVCGPGDCVASDWIRGGISGILMESEQNGIFGE